MSAFSREGDDLYPGALATDARRGNSSSQAIGTQLSKAWFGESWKLPGNKEAVVWPGDGCRLGLASRKNRVTFRRMSASFPPDSQNTPALPVELSIAHLQVHYANLCRGMMGAEEVILDFGFNPNSSGRVTDEPAQLTSRIILTVPSAVRLHQLLHALLAKRQEAVQQAQASALEGTHESAAPPA